MNARCLTRIVSASLFVGLTAAITSVVSATPAHACSCVYPTDGTRVSEHVRDTATGDGAVFVGTPTSKRHEPDAVYYDFAVRNVYQGDVAETTTVSTALHSAACGTSFDMNTEYVVFTTTYDTRDAPWSVNMCSPTTLATDVATHEAAVEVFGEPRPPAPNNPTSDTLVLPALGIGIAAVLAAGIAVWARRRGH